MACCANIRTARHIRTAVITCRVCGATGPESELHVSVRATIAALVRFGIASKGVARVLERDWAAYRRQNDLDLFGHALDQQRPSASRCLHPGASDVRYWFFWESETRDFGRIKEKIKAFINGAPVQARS